MEQSQHVSQAVFHPPQQAQDFPQQAAFPSMPGNVAVAQVMPACSAAAGSQPQVSGQSAAGTATECTPLSPSPVLDSISTRAAADDILLERSAEPVRQLQGSMEQSGSWHAPISGLLKPSLPARHVHVPHSMSATAAEPMPLCLVHLTGQPQISAGRSAGDATAIFDQVKAGPAFSTSSCKSQPSDTTSTGQACRISFPRFLQARPNRTNIPQGHQAPQPLKVFHGSDISHSSSTAVPALPHHPAQPHRSPSRSTGVLTEQLDHVSQLDETMLAASDSKAAPAHGLARRRPDLGVACSDGQAAGSHDAETHRGLHGSQTARHQADVHSDNTQPQASSGGLTAHEKLALRWRIGYKR